MTLKRGASDQAVPLVAPSTSRDYNSHTIRLPQALSFNSVCFSPNWPAVSCCPRGKRSIAPAKCQSLSICPWQSHHRVSSATVQSSLSSSTVLDWSICRFRMNPHCFLDQAHFAVPFALYLPSGDGEVSHRATGSETICCAPIKRCGTAQDGLGDDGSQTVKINLHNTH